MTQFAPNDQLRHPGKPEWGTGTVLTAQSATHEGKPCQRLTVRFSGAGKKTINTGFAKLVPLGNPAQDDTPKADSAPQSPKKPAQRPAAPPPQAQATPANEPPPEKPLVIARLQGLPAGLADPFRSIEDRLAATFTAYRYRPGDRTLLEWAVAQTGLADPLSVLSRHELEEHYTTFRIRLDQHLKALLDEARRGRVDSRPIIDAQAPAVRAEVQHALRRINPAR